MGVSVIENQNDGTSQVVEPVPVSKSRFWPGVLGGSFCILVAAGVYMFVIQAPLTLTTSSVTTIAIDDQVYPPSAQLRASLRFGRHRVTACVPRSLCTEDTIFFWPFLTQAKSIGLPQVESLDVPRLTAIQAVGEQLVMATAEDWATYQAGTLAELERVLTESALRGVDENNAQAIDDLGFLSDYEGNTAPYDYTIIDTILFFLRETEQGSVLVVYDRIFDEVSSTIPNVVAYAVDDGALVFVTNQREVYRVKLDAPTESVVIGTWPDEVVSFLAHSGGFLVLSSSGEEQTLSTADATLQNRQVVDRGKLVHLQRQQSDQFLASYERLGDTQYATILLDDQLAPTEITPPTQTVVGLNGGAYASVRYVRMNNTSQLPHLTEIADHTGRVLLQLAGEQDVLGLVRVGAKIVVALPNTLYEVPYE